MMTLMMMLLLSLNAVAHDVAVTAVAVIDAVAHADVVAVTDVVTSTVACCLEDATMNLMMIETLMKSP